jgi:hypothetical protein
MTEALSELVEQQNLNPAVTHWNPLRWVTRN